MTTERGAKQPFPSERMALSIAEVADAIGLGRTFIYEQINAGALKAIKVGRRTLVPIEAINGWLAAQPAFKKEIDR